MARIFGIEIPNEKRIEASLPYIFGVGRPTAAKILEQAGIDPDIPWNSSQAWPTSPRTAYIYQCSYS